MAKKVEILGLYDQDWFLALDTVYRDFYHSMIEKVNHAGIWRPNKTTYENNSHDKKKIDLDKFFEQVNKTELRISVLPDNTWYLHYHISSTYGPLFNPRFTKVISALKTALLSGVPLDWIKGFPNANEIDEEAIKNSYTQHQTKFVSGLTSVNALSPKNNNTVENKREVKNTRLKGVAINFAMPVVTYVDRGSPQDEQIELWLEAQEFTEVIEQKNIHSPILLSNYVDEFIGILKLGKYRDVPEIQNYFGNWIRTKTKGQPLTIKTSEDLTEGKSPPGKFDSLKNSHKKPNHNDKKE